MTVKQRRARFDRQWRALSRRLRVAVVEEIREGLDQLERAEITARMYGHYDLAQAIRKMRERALRG